MMRHYRTLSLLVLALAALGTGAEASPITLSAGQSQIFNWDFVAQGVTPLPPYPSITIDINDTGLDTPPEEYLAEVFSVLNAGGTSFFQGTNLGAFTTNSPLMVDGVFSVRITVNNGTVTFDPRAWGNSSAGLNVTGEIAALGQTTAPVPEPATLSLLGIGLAGAGLRRWRRRPVQTEARKKG